MVGWRGSGGGERMMVKTTGWVIKCYSGTSADAKIGNGRSLNICNDGISLASVILSMDKDDEEGWKRLSLEACSNHSIETTRAG